MTPVTDMLNLLLSAGLTDGSRQRGTFDLPGAFRHVPTITTYNTPEIPVQTGVHNAKLEQRVDGSI
jgi:hypothetical protein